MSHLLNTGRAVDNIETGAVESAEPGAPSSGRHSTRPAPVAAPVPGDLAMQTAATPVQALSPAALHALHAAPVHTPLAVPPFELRFESLFHSGRALSFPCDARGQVELDALSERARRNYFYARTVVGREFATPTVVPAQRD
jgi:hypothetical protein